MGYLIDRQDAITVCNSAIDLWEGQLGVGALIAVRDKIAELTIKPERKKGKWTIKNGELAFWDVCSECKKMVMHKAPFYNFCPNCGADMRGEQR